MKLTRFLTLALLVALTIPAWGQTALTSTTLAEVVNDTETRIDIASATGVAAGDIAYVDKEAMVVISVDATNNRIVVQRGMAGTVADDHANSTTIFIDLPGRFISKNLSGACTAGSEFPDFTPLINLSNGNRYECVNSLWTQLSPAVHGDMIASFVQGGTAADALDTIFFIATRSYRVTDIDAVWGTAESTGAMDIQVDRLQGTEACASGDNLLSAVIDATGTANTVANGALTATVADLILAAGDRLCVDLTATPNEVVNMVVTVHMEPN